MRRKPRRLFSALYILAAFALIVMSARVIDAQDRVDRLRQLIDDQQEANHEKIATTVERVNNLDRRVTAFEAANYPDRIARMEALAEANHALLLTMAGGVFLLVIKELILFKINSRRKTQPALFNTGD